MVSAELKELVAETARKVQDARLGRERAHRHSEIEETHLAGLVDDAAVAAGEIFAWADGPDGRELRLLMAYTGLDMLPLGTQAINLVHTTGELLADNCARAMVRRRIVVTTAQELVRIAGVRNVMALAERIRAGVIDSVLARNLELSLSHTVPATALLGIYGRPGS